MAKRSACLRLKSVSLRSTEIRIRRGGSIRAGNKDVCIKLVKTRLGWQLRLEEITQ